MAPELFVTVSSEPSVSKLAVPATTVGSSGLPKAEPAPINSPMVLPKTVLAKRVFLNRDIIFSPIRSAFC